MQNLEIQNNLNKTLLLKMLDNELTALNQQVNSHTAQPTNTKYQKYIDNAYKKATQSIEGYTPKPLEENKKRKYIIEKEIEDVTLEDLNIFYEDYVDNLKYQAEVLQDETQQAIDKFEGMYNISYMKDEG